MAKAREAKKAKKAVADALKAEEAEAAAAAARAQGLPVPIAPMPKKRKSMGDQAGTAASAPVSGRQKQRQQQQPPGTVQIGHQDATETKVLDKGKGKDVATVRAAGAEDVDELEDDDRAGAAESQASVSLLGSTRMGGGGFRNQGGVGFGGSGREGGARAAFAARAAAPSTSGVSLASLVYNNRGRARDRELQRQMDKDREREREKAIMATSGGSGSSAYPNYPNHPNPNVRYEMPGNPLLRLAAPGWVTDDTANATSQQNGREDSGTPGDSMETDEEDEEADEEGSVPFLGYTKAGKPRKRRAKKREEVIKISRNKTDDPNSLSLHARVSKSPRTLVTTTCSPFRIS